jgi:signal transduction histidine kinase
MFTTLRARLWLSYALLIGLMLALTAAALIIALLRNPQVYRTVLPRLQLVETQVVPKAKQIVRQTPQRFQELLNNEVKNRQVRLAVVDANGNVIADSGQGKEGAFPVFDTLQLADSATQDLSGLVRDERKRNWVYTAERINQNYYLVVALRVAKLPLVDLLTNDVVLPLILAGGIAFILAFLLAIGLSRWISGPLQRMAKAAQELANGKDVTLSEEGPLEVRELAQAFNQMNRQVHASQISQRDFVANVSHELKTPLTSIQGFAQAILEGAVQTPDALHQAAEVIYNESERMYRLVLDLLTLARLEAGTADLQRSPVDLGALLTNILIKFEPQAKKAQVYLAREIGDLPPVLGDGDRLAQVFTNLIDNALKFTPPGGSVSLNAKIQGNTVIIEVRDSGKGISSQDRERIFERFYQADKSRRGGGEHGVGLGLPIAKQIVQAHHGKIWVEGQPGQGSRFIVQLPVPHPKNQI